MQQTLSKNSYCVYESEVQKYIIPELGEPKLWNMENYDYMKFVNSLTNKLERKTIRDIVTKLKSILFYAEDNYGLRIRTRRIKMLSQEQISA